MWQSFKCTLYVGKIALLTSNNLELKNIELHNQTLCLSMPFRADDFYYLPMGANQWEMKVDPVWTHWKDEEPKSSDCVMANITEDGLWQSEECADKHLSLCQKIVRE